MFCIIICYITIILDKRLKKKVVLLKFKLKKTIKYLLNLKY